MDQKKRGAMRGYAYVACSRFKTRAGCFLYGRLRVSDFLPVGGLREDGKIRDEEVLERGYLSVSSDGDDGEGIALAYGNPLAGGMDSDDDVPVVAPPSADDVDFQVVFPVGQDLVDSGVAPAVVEESVVPPVFDPDFADLQEHANFPALDAEFAGLHESIASEIAGIRVGVQDEILSVLDPDIDFA